MKQYLIPAEGRFYKANLHTHSTYSDGALTPVALKTLYQQRGYDILAYTDHNVLNWFRELSDDSFLALCGYELDISTHIHAEDGITYNKTCHICAIVKCPETAKMIQKPDTYTPENANGMIRDLIEAGYLVHYNHPYWSNEDARDYLQLQGINAMEVYNTGCELNVNNGNTLSDYACMLRNGRRVNALATDDNHNTDLKVNELYEDDSCVGFTAIKAPSLTYAAIINALEQGHFYASWGPEIKSLYIDTDSNTLCIETSPARAIFLRSNNIGCRLYKFSPDNDVTHAEFSLSNTGENKVLWFEVIDAHKNIAVTNPYYPM